MFAFKATLYSETNQLLGYLISPNQQWWFKSPFVLNRHSCILHVEATG